MTSRNSPRRYGTLTECLSESEAEARILLVVPSPLNDPHHLRLQPELEAIYGVLKSLGVSIDIFRLAPPTLSALRVSLASKKFDIVHVAVHARREYLEFEEDDGTATQVDYERFAQCFAHSTARLLILNGCDTELIGDAIARTAAAIQTITIAGDIERRSALRIISSVYELLFSGLSPDQAASEASVSASNRRAVQARGSKSDSSLFSLALGTGGPNYFDCAPRNNLPPLDQKPFFDRETQTLEIYNALLTEETHAPYAGLLGMTGYGKTMLAQTFARRFSWRFPDGIWYFHVKSNPSVRAIADECGWQLGDMNEHQLAAEIAARLSEMRCLIVLDELETVTPETASMFTSLLSDWDTRLGGRAILILQSHRPEFDSVVGPNWIRVDQLPVDAACDLMVSVLGGIDRAKNIIGSDIQNAANLCLSHPRTLVSAGGLLHAGQPWRDVRTQLEKSSLNGPIGNNDEVLNQLVKRLETRSPLTRDILDAWLAFEDRCRDTVLRTIVAEALQTSESVMELYPYALSELQGASIIERYDLAGETRCLMHPLVVAHMRRHQRKLSEEKIRRIVEIGLREQLRLAGEIKHYPGDESANLLRGIKLANEHAMWATTLTVTSALFPSSEAQLIQRGPWDMAAEIIQLAETAAAETGNSPENLRISLLRGLVAYRMANLDEAQSAYQDALQLASELADSACRLAAIKGLGQVLYRQGRFQEAEEIYTQGRDVASSLDEGATAEIDHQLGKILMRKNRLDEARAAFERVLAARAGSKIGRDYAKTLHELARIQHLQSQLDQAEERYLRALELERSLGDLVMEQATLFQLAKLSLDRGDVEQAEDHFRESRRISESLNDRIWIAHAEFGQALVAWARADTPLTLHHVRITVTKCNELNIGLAREVSEWVAQIGLQGALDQI